MAIGKSMHIKVDEGDLINRHVHYSEATQVSLNSGHIKYLHYSEQETSLRHHYYYMKQFTK